ncbi:hypothetical protein BOTBODRAFT_373222 [Botryobasidium botryosum FD-172 SS1]|uniref:Uncharacterized protein n=1 Tax=Botryobasidium botryosum (strain FD-172 SS1) TaxID=930990 RepID=A0A067MFB2_BOTB1|nr:hypothetical protein BOTBODRAFT_373222 [Botryobasidium botryosum FD-172 SS1]
MTARGRSPSSFSDGQDSVVESTTSTAFVPPPIQRIKTISSNFSLPAAGRTLGKGFKRLGDLVERRLLYPEPDIGNTPQALAMINKFNRQWENGTKFKPSQLQQICGSLSLCLSESDEAVKLEALQCIIGLMKQEKALCVLFVSHKAYIQFEGLLRQPESLEVTKAAADAYLLLFRQLLSFPDNFRSELKDAMKLMMALETESSGIEGIGLVLSDQRLDEISRQLLDFSRYLSSSHFSFSFLATGTNSQFVSGPLRRMTRALQCNILPYDASLHSRRVIAIALHLWSASTHKTGWIISTAITPGRMSSFTS